MARNNLENNIRNKMQERKLQPSANAWSKLEAQLDAEPPKRKLVFWYYAAASVVGLMFFGSAFYYLNDVKMQPQLVEQKVMEDQIDQDINILPETFTDKEIAVEESSLKSEEKSVSSNDETKNTPSVNSVEIKKDIENFGTIAIVEEDVKPELNEIADSKENDHYLDQKAQEVAIDIKTLQENKGEVTMEEVEDMLEKARREIFLNRSIKQSQVDAVVLLNEVEWELDKTFYDKVFNALGEGFRKIATAYTERNR